MTCIYTYIFFLLLFILAMSYYNTYMYSKYAENFEKRNTTDIILLGDSILKNNSYVSDGKGIDVMLKERNIANVHSFAVNHSNIVDVYSQITSISSDLNKPDTYIFLSIGGNDILQNFVENDGDEEKDHILKTMFKAYKKLVESIQTKMNKSKLILLDIYYPTNMKYDQHRPIIEKWNSMIEQFKNNNHQIYSVLYVSKILTKPHDFTFDIEPSSIGGKKIVDEIINFI